MQKRDERTDGRKAFYNLPTTAFGRRREIIITGYKCYIKCVKSLNLNAYWLSRNSKERELQILQPVTAMKYNKY